MAAMQQHTLHTIVPLSLQHCVLKGAVLTDPSSTCYVLSFSVSFRDSPVSNPKLLAEIHCQNELLEEAPSNILRQSLPRPGSLHQHE